jgi:multiple sugar transport system substrate-binding protein
MQVRTVLSHVLVACLAGATLVACSDDGPPSPEPTPTASTPTASQPPSPRSGPLRLSVYGVPSTLDAYRDVARAFTAESDVAVDLQTYPDARRAAAAARQALEGAGPAPDVFLLDNAYLPDLLTTGRLQHVDLALEARGLQFGDGYQRVALTGFSADAVLQCMPVDMSPHVLVINRDHVRPRDLEVRGVPLPEEGQWTFEDFDAAARLISREHQDEPDFRAVHLPTDIRLLTAFIRSAGGDIVDDVDDPTSLTLDSDEAREALLAYVGLARQRAVALTAEEAETTSPLDRFGRGELAMMFGTRANVPALRESDVPFDVMPLPSFGSYRTVADISGLCVDEQSGRLEDALDLVAFVAGNDGSTTLARSGAVLPANLDVAFSPAVVQRGQRPRSVQVFGEALKRSGLMPFSTTWRPVADGVEAFVTRLMGNRRDLARVLERRLPLLDERSQAVFEGAAEVQ